MSTSAVHGREIGATGWAIAGSVAAFSFGQFLSSSAWGLPETRVPRTDATKPPLGSRALLTFVTPFARLSRMEALD